jgi:hypothetical protein
MTDTRKIGLFSIIRTDGYINAATMCPAGVRFHAYEKHAKAKELLKVYDKRSTRGFGACTWIHPKIAVHFANWLDINHGTALEAGMKAWLEPDSSAPPTPPDTTASDSAPPSPPAPSTSAPPSSSAPSTSAPASANAAVTALEIRSYSDCPIERRKSDGFVNATGMATACRKRWADFAKTQRAQDYMIALENDLRPVGQTMINDIVELTIVDSRCGRFNSGTWIHPRLAIDFARWLSPKFAVWMDGWLLGNLFTKPREILTAQFHASPQTRGTGAVRSHLYVGVAPNLEMIKIGNSNNLKNRQSQHRSKPRDESTFHDKDYRHLLCCEGYGHLDQLLLKQYPERRINNSDRLKGCEIDIDAIIEMIPQLQEQWELENPQQDNEHERGLKRRREESDVQLYEATNKAKAAEASAKAAEASAKAEEASAKAAEVSVNVERSQLDNELYRIKLQMLKEGKITLEDMK